MLYNITNITPSTACPQVLFIYLFESKELKNQCAIDSHIRNLILSLNLFKQVDNMFCINCKIKSLSIG